MSNASIGVLLVDDHAVLRQGIATMLARAADVRVVGEAADGEAAVRIALAERPDVVLMDVGLPGLSGIDATKQILAELPATRVLALSAFNTRQHVLSMLRAGASGYLVKDCVFEELHRAIAVVADGGRYLSPDMTPMLLEGVAGSGNNGNGHASDQLTQREREVLQLLAGGKAMKEAAAELRISTKTVETHRRAIMDKLQIFSVAELTKHAIREGLTTLD